MSNEEVQIDWPLVGNRHITEYLKKSINRDKVAGAYVFHGPEDLGKTTAAIYFAQSLLCYNPGGGTATLPCRTCPACRLFNPYNEDGKADTGAGEAAHGDCHIIRREPGRKNIPVELVRELIKILSMSSFMGGYKIGIVRDADNLSEEAANALLKTLEEPRQKVVIILIANDLEFLPATITSRSQVMEFRPVNREDIYEYLLKERGATRSEARNLSRLSLGRPALAVKLHEDKEFHEDREKIAGTFIDFFTQDVNARLSGIGELLGPDTTGQAAAPRAGEILGVWRSLARDWLLLQFNHDDLVQHQPLINKMRQLGDRMNAKKIMGVIGTINRGRNYLNSNVNARAALEGVAISI